jgi:type I restriction enzyme, S subunit
MRDGYKLTELGEIPEHWDVNKIGNFADVTAGGTPSTIIKKYWGGDIPWMNSGEINLRRVKSVEGRITLEGLSNSSTKKIPINSILIALAGQGKTRGKVAINEIEVCINQSLAAIYNLRGVNNDFLFQNLESRYSELRKMSTGDSGRGGLNLSIIKSVLVALPPKHEQIKIAEILSTVDKKIEVIDQQITQTEELKKGLMQQLFTKGIGHTLFKDSPLGKIPDGWEVVKIDNLLESNRIISHLDGNHGELYPKANEFTEDGVPYIGANSFVNGKVDFSLCKRLNIDRAKQFKKGVAKNGDVLFAHNATVGPVAYLETHLEYVILSTTVTYYRLDNKTIDSKYWLYFLSSHYFIGQYSKVMGQSTRNQVPITMQRSFIAILPPFTEQCRLASILDTLDTKLEILHAKKYYYEILKKGLMQQLLTGKIRVKIN